MPLPLRPPRQDRITSIPHTHQTQGLKRKFCNTVTDEGSEIQQISKKSRVERGMVKNFRLQLIPLAQTPAVSNVRRADRRLHQQICTTTQKSRRNSAPNSLDQEDFSQLLSTGDTGNHSLTELLRLVTASEHAGTRMGPSFRDRMGSRISG